MIRRPYVSRLLLLATAGIGLAACQPFRNFTTYFNLFYNMERIMDEVEEDLLYTREQKLGEPVFYIPGDDLERRGVVFYDHLERRTMSNEEMRSAKVKLDSILEKGSKLLTFKEKSDYVDDAVYYMGKAFFYEREWYRSQKKMEELVANFPESRWQPDAHLLWSMDLMHLGDRDGAEQMLSRTIDIAWAHRRSDVLSEAFRLNADLHLADGDLQVAVRPYHRALRLAGDDVERARWMYELGMIYFRRGEYEQALARFDSVGEYSPDVLVEFQNGMQRAATLRALTRYDDAAEQLEDLADNGNYEPWWGMVAMEQLNLQSARSSAAPSDTSFAALDSISPGKGYSNYIVYERGVRAFRSGDYKRALENFAKAQTTTAPFQRRARFYAVNLSNYFDQTGRARNIAQDFQAESFPDTTRAQVAEAYYNAGRIFVTFAIPDSIDRYYDLSAAWAPAGSREGARVLYARAMRALDQGRRAEADSLLDIIVNDPGYGLTEYAADARRRLGYTEFAVVDPAEDLYRSGTSHMSVGEPDRALVQFRRVVAEYPQTTWSPRALYAIGLLYEGALANRDSAFETYRQLMLLYPKSEQARAVAPLIEAVNRHRMTHPQGGASADSARPGEENLVPLDAPLPNQQSVPARESVRPREGIPANGEIPVDSQPSVDPSQNVPPKGSNGEGG